jgi:hypothetical protein
MMMIIIKIIIIIKSNLNAKNKITANGSLVVTVLRYGFGIIVWRVEEIRNFDRETRKVLTIYKLHNPKGDIDRLYTVRHLCNVTDIVLTKIEVLSTMQCMPSMCPNFICNLATPHNEHDGKYGAMLCR